MLDFGNVNGHANAVTYGDINGMDAPATYTISMWMRLNLLAGGAARSVFTKWQAGNNGWVVQNNAANQIQVSHNNGAGWGSAAATTAMVAGTLYHHAIVWDGVNARFYRNGVVDGAPAFNRAIVANATAVCLGNDPGLANGCGCALGHVMWWNTNLPVADIPSLYAGAIPNPSALHFWAPGWYTPGIEIMQNNVGVPVQAGAVTVLEDPFRNWPMPLRPSGWLFPQYIPPTPKFVLIN